MENMESLDLFVFGTGLGEKGNLNFCCEIKTEEDKKELLELVQKINKKKIKK